MSRLKWHPVHLLDNAYFQRVFRAGPKTAHSPLRPFMDISANMCNRWDRSRAIVMKGNNSRRIPGFALMFLFAFGLQAASNSGYQFVNAFGQLTFTQPLCIRTPPGESNRVFVL